MKHICRNNHIVSSFNHKHKGQKWNWCRFKQRNTNKIKRKFRWLSPISSPNYKQTYSHYIICFLPTTFTLVYKFFQNLYSQHMWCTHSRKIKYFKQQPNLKEDWTELMLPQESWFLISSGKILHKIIWQYILLHKNYIALQIFFESPEKSYNVKRVFVPASSSWKL